AAKGGGTADLPSLRDASAGKEATVQPAEPPAKNSDVEVAATAPTAAEEPLGADEEASDLARTTGIQSALPQDEEGKEEEAVAIMEGQSYREYSAKDEASAAESEAEPVSLGTEETGEAESEGTAPPPAPPTTIADASAAADQLVPGVDGEEGAERAAPAAAAAAAVPHAPAVGGDAPGDILRGDTSVTAVVPGVINAGSDGASVTAEPAGGGGVAALSSVGSATSLSGSTWDVETAPADARLSAPNAPPVVPKKPKKNRFGLQRLKRAKRGKSSSNAHAAALDMPPAGLGASGSPPSGAPDTSTSSVGAFSVDGSGNTDDTAGKAPSALPGDTKKMKKKGSFRLKLPSSLKRGSKSSKL
ncbi:unnamed protein product, partial [Pylaiella littoralis]